MRNGIPGHDTSRRVFEVLEPKEVEMRFADWVNMLERNPNIEAVGGVGDGTEALELVRSAQPEVVVKEKTWKP